jgi:hypothetical protein
MAIAANQRFGDRLGASRAVELGGGLVGLGHTVIIDSVVTALRKAGKTTRLRCVFGGTARYVSPGI